MKGASQAAPAPYGLPAALTEGHVQPGAAAESPVPAVLTNSSGVDLVAGDVVVVASDGTITTTTTAQDTRPVGVLLDDIAAGDEGQVAFDGPVDLVNVTAAVTAGHYAETTTTAKKATGSSARRGGSFAVFTSSGATPSAFLIGAVQGASALTTRDASSVVSVASVETLIFDDGTVTNAGSGAARVRGLPSGFIGCKAVRTADETFVTAVAEVINFTAADAFDTDGFHDPGGANPDRVTIPAGLGGPYLIVAGARWTNNATGNRSLEIAKNGTSLDGIAARQDNAGGTNTAGYHATAIAYLAAGDYISVSAFQSSGGNLDLLDAFLVVVKLDAGRVGSGIGAKVVRTTNQTPITAPTAIQFDTELWDTDGFHSTSSNTERLTVPAGLGGKYLVVGWAYATGIDAGKYVHYRLYVNGTVSPAGVRFERPASSDASLMTLSAIVDLVAGDYVTLTAESDDTSFTISTSGSGAGVVPSLAMMRLDSQPGPGVWQTYTPTWTNLTVGNGTVTAKWKYLDQYTIVVSINLTWGSTTSASGAVSVSLPPGITTAARVQSGPAVIVDQGTAYFAGVVRVAASSTSIGAIVAADGTGSRQITATVPMTWVTTDDLTIGPLLLEIA